MGAFNLGLYFGVMKSGTTKLSEFRIHPKNICLCWPGLCLFGLVRSLSLVVSSLLAFGTVYTYPHRFSRVLPNGLGW